MIKMLSFLLFLILSTDLIASTSQCTFMGNNSQVALQKTYALINDLKSLRDRGNCYVADKSFTSLEAITKFYQFQLQNSSLENKILIKKQQLEELSAAYADSMDPSYFYYMIDAQSELIEAEAMLKLSKTANEEEFKKTTLQNLVSEISNLINDVPNYDSCFENDPRRATNIIGGILNLSGSIAGMATLDPVWASAGNIIGGLVTQLGNAINNFRWKYINELEERVIFKNMMCMIETQANYYCEKDTENFYIEQLMRLAHSVETDEKPLWQGFEIQEESIPVLQYWIKKLYRGTPAANPTDANMRTQIEKRVTSANGILEFVRTKYDELREKIDEEGDIYTLLNNYSSTISNKMTGFMTGTGMHVAEPGWVYFNQRFTASAMRYILVAPPHIASTLKTPPVCPEGMQTCNVFDVFLKNSYAGGHQNDLTEEHLRLAVNNMKTNLQMIEIEVSKDMDRDLLTRRETSAEDLLGQYDIRDEVYDITAKKGLRNILTYLDDAISTLKQFYSKEGENFVSSEFLTDDSCLNHKDKERNGCPIIIQIALEARSILNQIQVILDNESIDPKVRVKELTDLLEFNERRSLLLIPKFELILKKDLEARIALKIIAPSEDELLHLKRRNVVEMLRREGLENDLHQARMDRKQAMMDITQNLKAFIRIKPLKDTIIKHMKSLIDDFNNGTMVDLSVFNEGCAILLSLPYGRNPNNRNNEYIELCQNSTAVSGWNETRLALGLERLPELDVVFNDHYQKDFTDRVCTFSNRTKKNAIYAIREKK